MYSGSPVVMSRKFPCLENLPVGLFHKECFCLFIFAEESSWQSSVWSSAQSKNNSSSDSEEKILNIIFINSDQICFSHVYIHVRL